MTDEDSLEDELCVIESIFGDDCVASLAERKCIVFVPSKHHQPRLVLHLFFPADYPASAPLLELEAPQLLSEDQLQDTMDELLDLFLPGEVVAFNMIELLREREELWATGPVVAPSVAEEASPGGDHFQGGEAEAGEAPVTYSDEQLRLMKVMAARIVTGEPYTERKSTFQAHVARVESVEEVQAMMRVLLQDGKIRRATHNMLAYRFVAADKGTVHQDFDDDGESAAGSRLLHLLQVAGVEGVCVCVSRWFGGTLLGPSRFTIINNTARQLLVREGYLPDKALKRGGKKK